MANATTRIADALTKHGIDLLRVEAGLRKKIIKMINELEADYIKAIYKFDPTTPTAISAKLKQLDILIASTGKTTVEAYQSMHDSLQKDLMKMVEAEAKNTANTINRIIHVELASVRLNKNVLQHLVDGTLIEGAPSADWWKKADEQMRFDFERIMRNGILTGKSVPELVRDVRGTAANGFKDGIMQAKRYQAERLVRSSGMAVVNKARLHTYEANSDVIKGIQVLATLDSHTSDICKALDGQAWSLDYKPLPGTQFEWPGEPPYHWNCRTTTLPVLKSWDELSGTKDPVIRAKLKKHRPHKSIRASMDGGVSGDMNYGEWLKTKDTGILDPGKNLAYKILGKTKYALWKDGKIGMTDLISQTHNPMTVDQLVAKVAGKEAQQAIATEALAIKNATTTEAAATAAKQEAIAKAQAAQKGLTKEVGAKQLERSVTKAKETAAAMQIDEIKSNGKVLEKKALKHLESTGQAAQYTPSKLLAKVKEDAAVLQKKAGDAAALTKYKKSVLAGTKPPQYAQAVYDNLDDVSKKAIDDVIAAAKAKEVAAAVAKEAEVAKVAANQKAGVKLAELADGKGKKLEVKAFQKLKGTIDSKTQASEFLKQVQDEAAIMQEKASKAAAITKYKQAKIAGKKVPPYAQKAYDSLEDADKILVNDAILGKKTAATATKTLEETKKTAKVFAPTDSKYYASKADEIAGLTKNINEDDAMYQVELFLQDEGDPLAVKAAKEVMSEVDVNNTDPITILEHISAKVNAQLEHAAQGAVSVAEAQASAEAAMKGELDLKDFKKIGDQAGSNWGGLYKNTITKEDWYVKVPASENIARNEVLANKLYEKAGISVPDVRLIKTEKGTGVASKIIKGLKRGTDSQFAKGAYDGLDDGFAVDAWLGNWDVAGANMDNLLVKGGKAYRIDNGGALLYRAQGAPKGTAFGKVVNEIDTLRDASRNPQTAKAFQKLTKAQLKASVKRVTSISDDEIRAMVHEYGPADQKMADDLADTLIERKRYLAKEFDTVEKAMPPPASAKELIDTTDLEKIRISRGNGYAIPTDGGEIEDQSVLIWQEFDDSGKIVTRASFKVRGEGIKKMQEVTQAGRTITQSINEEASTLDSKIIQTLKGAKTNATSIRIKDIQRAREAKMLHREMVDKLDDLTKKGYYTKAQSTAIKKSYKEWMDEMDNIANTDDGLPIRFKKAGLFKAPAHPEPKQIQVNPNVKYKFHKTQAVYHDAKIENGYIHRKNTINRTFGIAQEGDIDGAQVRYIRSEKSVENFFANLDTVEIKVPGGDKEAANRIMETINKLGLDNHRASAADMEELYLQQIAYLHGEDVSAIMRTYTDQSLRITELKKTLSKAIGRNITSLPEYNPAGVRQAYQAGRRLRYRPDLVGPGWNKFEQNMVIAHAEYSGDMAKSVDRILSSGGMLTPTTDKLRRGIELHGMSPESDMGTGGASYFFTRIKTRQSATNTIGYIFKPRALKRMDAISYSGDMYGRVTGSTVRDYRVTDINKLYNLSNHASNETIFKNGVSLFDDLEAIVVRTEGERKDVIAVFKKHGYTILPDGRKVADVVKVSGEVL